MLNWIIRQSLKNPVWVLLLALCGTLAGIDSLRQLAIDVFPDLNRPTVTIMTEAPGLAPEEVEVLVTRPIEWVLNGATGVRRVRSSSAIGLSIVWIEFDWNTEIFRDRQIVSEKLQLARAQLPVNVEPVLAPISSIMGEIMLLGLRDARTVDDTLSTEEKQRAAMDLRTLAEFTIRNRLLSIDGVSQVSVMGGILKQYQVITSPERLAVQNVTLEQLVAAAEKANVVAGGGILVRSPQEALIRIQGSSVRLEDIEETPIVYREGVAVQIRDVADVRWGGPIPRGDAAVWTNNQSQDGAGTTKQGGPAVMMAIQKQPHADTVALDERIDAALAELEAELPEHVRLEAEIFRQSRFIEQAVENVVEAVRDGALWVVVVLFLFMGNFRISISSLTSMPLSILLTFLVFRWCGITINTMTLGGIAVAIGDLVDDSIVDVENIFRRLRENQQRPPEGRQPTWQVVYDASCEVRNSIVYATCIVVLVVCPLFAMSGLEGRLFAPLGTAYIVSLVCSLLVSLTVTPVLGALLLPRARWLEGQRDPWLLRVLKAADRRLLQFTLRHATAVLIVVTLGVVGTCASIGWMGGEFLPPFNEGTVTLTLRMSPGTSLDESRRMAARVEQDLLAIPEVVSVARRTGRAEWDEHAEGVHASELDVRLIEPKVPRTEPWAVVARWVPLLESWGYTYHGRDREAITADIRGVVATIAGVDANVGQPIAHRLDHMMSGIRAQIAVKIFGSDLRELRAAAYDLQTAMGAVPGVVDLQVEPQVEIPQIRLRVNRRQAALVGLAPGDVASLLETAYKGRVVSQVLSNDQFFSLVVWYDEASRNDPEVIQRTILETPSGRRVTLGQVAEVEETTGPNGLNRENAQRRAVVFCNVADRSLADVARDVRAAIEPIQTRLANHGMRIELSGQFEAQQAANRRLLALGSVAIVGVFLLLCQALSSWRAALQVMANIPLAALGSVVALWITNRPAAELLAAAAWWQWPAIWASAINLSVAHWVGFITLMGVVSRNGIMMISHYLHLMEEEGESFGEEMIIRGSLERLAPVMMTAATSFIGLLPLLWGAEDTGKEILHPLAIVVFGGMVASTLLDQMVTPALFYKFGRPIAARIQAARDNVNVT